jgi:hypothetical protein
LARFRSCAAHDAPASQQPKHRDWTQSTAATFEVLLLRWHEAEVQGTALAIFEMAAVVPSQRSQRRRHGLDARASLVTIDEGEAGRFEGGLVSASPSAAIG